MKLFFILLCLCFVVHPGHAQDDDEEMLRQLENEKRIQTEKYQQINEGAEAIKSAPSKMLSELQNASQKNLDLKALVDPKMVEMFKRLIHESKIHETPPEQMREMILLKTQGKALGKLFLRFPKLLDIAVAIMIDKEALTSLMGILPRQEDLKFFGYCSLGLFLFGFLVKRFIVSKKDGFFKRAFIFISIQLSISAIYLSLFFYLFNKELGPMLKIIGQHL